MSGVLRAKMELNKGLWKICDKMRKLSVKLKMRLTSRIGGEETIGDLRKDKIYKIL